MHSLVKESVQFFLDFNSLHSEHPKLYGVLAVLSAIRLKSRQQVPSPGCATYVWSPLGWAQFTYDLGSVKLSLYPMSIRYILLQRYQKADDKIFVCKFSKHVKSKLYCIENSKTRGQTV